MNRLTKALVIAGTAAAVALLPACSSMNQQTQVCTVQAKERLLQNGSSGEKRVYTTCGGFSVEDNLTSGFNSYDLFQRLQEGKTYEIRSGGYRIGFLSTFPNILEVKEVK